MIKGGIGGGNTKTGLHFEERVNFCDLIKFRDGYSVLDEKVFYKGELVALSLKKHGLYGYLRERGIDHTTLISKKLLPDDALYVLNRNTIYVIEVKFQDVAGSTDEKLQTCDFKIKQYKKLFSDLGCKVEYIYVLNGWFKKPEYADVLDYINSIEGCAYFFDELPLGVLGLL